jgi:DNA-binding LacI/PurR family transcriptional regulator
MRRIDLWLRQQNLQPGDRLPSEAALAEQFKISRLTLRKAMALLASQGNLEIRRGVGWFVRERATTRIALCTEDSILASFTSLYYRWVADTIRRAAQAHDMDVHLLLVDRQHAISASDARLLRSGDLRGVIVTGVHVSQTLRERLLASGLPVLGLFRPADGFELSVELNDVEIIKPLVDRAREAGARRIGLLKPWSVQQAKITSRLKAKARQAGIDLDLTWEKRETSQEQDSIASGHQTAKFWLKSSPSDRPDALVGGDHFLFHGMIYEFLAAGITPAQAPRMLVIEAAEAPLPLPWPVHRLGYRAGPAVEKAVNLLVGRIQGRTILDRHLHVPMVLDQAQMADFSAAAGRAEA